MKSIESKKDTNEHKLNKNSVLLIVIISILALLFTFVLIYKQATKKKDFDFHHNVNYFCPIYITYDSSYWFGYDYYEYDLKKYYPATVGETFIDDLNHYFRIDTYIEMDLKGEYNKKTQEAFFEKADFDIYAGTPGKKISFYDVGIFGGYNSAEAIPLNEWTYIGYNPYVTFGNKDLESDGTVHLDPNQTVEYFENDWSNDKYNITSSFYDGIKLPPYQFHIDDEIWRIDWNYWDDNKWW